MSVNVEYDRESDALYVLLRPGVSVLNTQPLDDGRLVDLAADGDPVGIEFLDVSYGIDLGDIPAAETVERLIRESGFTLPVPA